jgi:hypothetical protein
VRVYEFEDREPRVQAVVPRLRSNIKAMGTVGEGNWLRDVQGSTDNGNVRLPFVSCAWDNVARATE